MPWYRIDGLSSLVHIRGTKLPPPCPHRTDAGEACRRMAGLLCDYPLGLCKTCDTPICDRCAVEISPDTHHCPKHDPRGARLSANSSRSVSSAAGNLGAGDESAPLSPSEAKE